MNRYLKWAGYVGIAVSVTMVSALLSFYIISKMIKVGERTGRVKSIRFEKSQLIGW